jgi:hypothetical protein
MLNWLKRRLRKWLEIDSQGSPVSTGKPSMDLLCFNRKAGRANQTITYQIVGAMGLHLVGQTIGADAGEVRMISSGEAVDPDHWSAIWKHLNPGIKMVWEDDGAPFEP